MGWFRDNKDELWSDRAPQLGMNSFRSGKTWDESLGDAGVKCPRSILLVSAMLEDATIPISAPALYNAFDAAIAGWIDALKANAEAE